MSSGRVCPLLIGASLLGAARAGAEPAPAPIVPSAEAPALTVNSERPRHSFVLAPRPGLAVGLAAHGGFSTLLFSETRSAFAIAGGTLRVRAGRVLLGARYQTSDRTSDNSFGNGFHSLGGFLGTHLSFQRWLDFEFAAGLASRTYLDDDVRYGPHGYRQSGPAASLHVGVSDRSSARLLGVRFGAELEIGYDLHPVDRHWEKVYLLASGVPLVFSGDTRVGGLSTAVLISAAFEVATPERH